LVIYIFNISHALPIETNLCTGASREVEVKDVSRTTLKEVLNYVYSDCFDEKTDIPALASPPTSLMTCIKA